MAIHETLSDDHKQVHSAYAMSSKVDDLAPCPLYTQSSIRSASANTNNKRLKSNNKAVYLCKNSIQLRSLTDGKSENKVVSSFQLAAKLYKSNSDELKTKNMRRKSNKKSVLTLPNEPAVLPQSCTVSDINDNEYFSHTHKLKPQTTKTRQSFKNKSSKPQNYNHEYYDRNAACSQMDVFLDCSSVNAVKNYKGDCRKTARGCYNSKTESEGTNEMNDVWAVLRNINKQRFYASPPMTDDECYEMKPRKKKAFNRKLKRRVYETCMTEEIAYFSNNPLRVTRGDSHSGSSQITVIDNQLNEVQKKWLDRNKPVVNSKNRRQDLRKNNSKRNKSLKLKSNPKKTFASKDTLVGPTSEEKLNSEQTPNKVNDSFERSLRNTVCRTIEVQTGTDLDRKEVEKLEIDLQPHTYKSVTNHGTMSDDLSSQNIHGLPNVRVPRGGPSLSRVPRRGTQQRPNVTPGRLSGSTILPERTLTNTPSKAVTGLAFSKLQDNPRVPYQTTPHRMHPLTQTDIRKVIAKYKFPLVILGKEQVSGTYTVEQYDYPQFGGLDKYVWPFMVNWTEKRTLSKLNTAAQFKNQALENKTTTSPDDGFTICNKKVQMGASHNNVKSKQIDVTKVKPASRLQDNILKFLYKKGSNHNMGKDILPEPLQRDTTVILTPMKDNSACSSNYKSIDKAVSNSSLTMLRTSTQTNRVNPRFSTTPPPPTHPSKILIAPQKREPQKIWGKAKRVNDFIENIINKIKCGAFYTNDVHLEDLKTTACLKKCTSDTNNDLKLDSKEVSIQVTMPTAAEDFTPKVTIQKKKELHIRLPGFEDVLPQLIEIKSMTRNQIAVKHSVMNVLLQFDVNVPPEADRSRTLKRAHSCALLAVTDSKTKVFKCKTKILNAVLPAELCSVIPKLMMQFLDKEASLAVTVKEETRNKSLSTISEYTMSEIQEPFKIPLLPLINISPELIWLSNGQFSKSPKPWTEKSNSNEIFYIISIKELPYKYSNVEGLLLSLQLSAYRDGFYEVHPSSALELHLKKPQSTSSYLSCQDAVTKPNFCTDLVLYTGKQVACGGSTSPRAPLTALNGFINMLTCNTNSITKYSPDIRLQTCSYRVYVNFSINNHQGIGASLCVDAHFGSYNVSTTISSTSIVNNERPLKQIEYIKHAELKQTEIRKPVPSVAITRKKGHLRYVKLYKKCKSTSHIVPERSSTPLSKVTNLDEFFQTMGSGQLLSSACDGSCGKKILACVSDLRSYTSGITPRQALLVMLLANKKDTSNLVRFRHMILQGIALHRITRVSELDLEVEVIENEKFNQMQEYLGAPPLTVSPQNNEHLLEELIWIAKTTASDHQRRFDESSEKLLETLLAKRKKLNPSYLRVMARYVGLGLLKSPVNH